MAFGEDGRSSFCPFYEMAKTNFAREQYIGLNAEPWERKEKRITSTRVVECTEGTWKTWKIDEKGISGRSKVIEIQAGMREICGKTGGFQFLLFKF